MSPDDQAFPKPRATGRLSPQSLEDPVSQAEEQAVVFVVSIRAAAQVEESATANQALHANAITNKKMNNN